MADRGTLETLKQWKALSLMLPGALKYLTVLTVLTVVTTDCLSSDYHLAFATSKYTQIGMNVLRGRILI